MRLKIKMNQNVPIFATLVFCLIIAHNALADSGWENLLEKGQLQQGVSAAVTAGVSVDEIGKKALAMNYPACDILVAMLNAKVDAYQSLKTLIAAGGNGEHLARCCAEPKMGVSSAVFAKAAIDAGLDPDTVDRLIASAYAPLPGEPGVFTREEVVAGGEIREGIASPVRP